MTTSEDKARVVIAALLARVFRFAHRKHRIVVHDNYCDYVFPAGSEAFEDLIRIHRRKRPQGDLYCRAVVPPGGDLLYPTLRYYRRNWC